MLAFGHCWLDLCCKQCLLLLGDEFLCNWTSYTHCRNAGRHNRTIFGRPFRHCSGRSRGLFYLLFGYSASSRRTPTWSDRSLLCYLFNKAFFWCLLNWLTSTTSRWRPRSRARSPSRRAGSSARWWSSWRGWAWSKWQLLLQNEIGRNLRSMLR